MGKLIIIERVGINNVDESVTITSGDYVLLYEINPKYYHNLNAGIRIPLDKNGSGTIVRGFFEKNRLLIYKTQSDNLSSYYVFNACYFSI